MRGPAFPIPGVIKVYRKSSPDSSTEASTILDDNGATSSNSQAVEPQERSRSSTHVAKFERLLSEKTVDLEALRKVAWSGVPPHFRPVTWRLLLGYLPPNKDRREAVLKRKRREYLGMVPEFYGEGREQSEEELAMRRQVQLDAPRTAPNEPFFQQEAIQKSLTRILFLWGIRHPASGYVQGINDLVTPFMAVFLSEHYSGSMDSWDVTEHDNPTLMDIEADCYWCLCRILDSIQDHYTYAQPGIQRKVFKIKELVGRINGPLAHHLEQEGVEFMLFAHRWVNCLLVREFPLLCGVRLWDTFLAEVEDFGDFFVYTCVSFLNAWGPKLLRLEFQELMMFLQKMPTTGWVVSVKTPLHSPEQVGGRC
eukprot:jgi/Tetstr1/442730/TSEL_030820.t1